MTIKDAKTRTTTQRQEKTMKHIKARGRLGSKQGNEQPQDNIYQNKAGNIEEQDQKIQKHREIDKIK